MRYYLSSKSFSQELCLSVPIVMYLLGVGRPISRLVWRSFIPSTARCAIIFLLPRWREFVRIAFSRSLSIMINYYMLPTDWKEELSLLINS